jgi:hypothetical protein
MKLRVPKGFKFPSQPALTTILNVRHYFIRSLARVDCRARRQLTSEVLPVCVPSPSGQSSRGWQACNFQITHMKSSLGAAPTSSDLHSSIWHCCDQKPSLRAKASKPSND